MSTGKQRHLHTDSNSLAPSREGTPYVLEYVHSFSTEHPQAGLPHTQLSVPQATFEDVLEASGSKAASCKDSVPSSV